MMKQVLLAVDKESFNLIKQHERKVNDFYSKLFAMISTKYPSIPMNEHGEIDTTKLQHVKVSLVKNYIHDYEELAKSCEVELDDHGIPMNGSNIEPKVEVIGEWTDNEKLNRFIIDGVWNKAKNPGEDIVLTSTDICVMSNEWSAKHNDDAYTIDVFNKAIDKSNDETVVFYTVMEG